MNNQNTGNRTAVHDQLTIADFMPDATKQLFANQWNLIGYKEVGITEMIELGYGMGNLETSVSRAFAAFQDSTPALVDGKVKISILDAQNNTILERWFESTLDLLGQFVAGTPLVPLPMKDRLPMPETKNIAQRERRIAFYIQPSADVTIVKANSKILLSITRYSL